nr:hypothetical protein [Mucilaginibacter sp. L294]
MTRRRFNIWFFSIGVLMLLARPYLAYQMSAANATAENPAKAWNLLQRLVKKKDEHHEIQADGAAILAETSCLAIHPLRRLLNTFFTSLTVSAKIILSATVLNSNFLLPANRYRYRLSSCFLI